VTNASDNTVRLPEEIIANDSVQLFSTAGQSWITSSSKFTCIYFGGNDWSGVLGGLPRAGLLGSV
jgi:hypothetical protein